MKGHPVPYLVISILYVHVTYYTDTPRPVPSFVNGIWSRMAADAGADDGTDGDQRWYIWVNEISPGAPVSGVWVVVMVVVEWRWEWRDVSPSQFRRVGHHSNACI